TRRRQLQPHLLRRPTRRMAAIAPTFKNLARDRVLALAPFPTVENNDAPAQNDVASPTPHPYTRPIHIFLLRGLSMSRTFFFVFFLALSTLFSFVRADPADTQPGAAPPAPAKIKLLIVTGGHPYPKTFFEQFDNNHDIVYTSAVEGDFKT